jgi:hypothetical protein
MSEAKLRPCPFCSGKVHISLSGHRRPRYAVACDKCRFITKFYGTEEKAVAAWNTRPIEDELHEACMDMASILNGLYLGTCIDSQSRVDMIRRTEDKAKSALRKAQKE